MMVRHEHLPFAMLLGLVLTMGASSVAHTRDPGPLKSLHPALLQEGPAIAPPAGPALTLDGTIAPGEWEGAYVSPLGSDGRVLLMTRGNALSVGIQGPDFGLAHLALYANDTVRILHASAALGSVVYAREGSTWGKVQDPTWEVRNPSLGPEALRQREDYLDTHGWVGTTGRMGTEGEIEFLLRPDAFGGSPLHLALAFLQMAGGQSRSRWPESNTDDVALLQLLTGPMPPTVQFDPGSWARVELVAG